MANLVLRTMYIDPDVDDELRTEAFDTRTSKNDLLRQYLKLGMEVVKQARLQSSAVETSSAKADLMTGIRSSAEPIAKVVLANLAPKKGKAVAKKSAAGSTARARARNPATKAAPAPKRHSAVAAKKPTDSTAPRKKTTADKASAAA